MNNPNTIIPATEAQFEAIQRIIDERLRHEQLLDEGSIRYDVADKATCLQRSLCVLTKSLGDLCDTVLDLRRETTSSEYLGGQHEEVLTEAVQTASVALAIVEALCK